MLETLCGRAPYVWQQSLLTCWLSKGRVPSTIDVPTGLGKTTVMSIWLAARAMAPAAGLPRRLVYVVDRRAVVDQATIEAEELQKRLGDGKSDPGSPVNAIRRALGLLPGQWLAVSTLRGQLADNRDWLEDPAAPAIIVGTVDMIGSRLLFEGYGVGRKMRPVHAGLLGADALVVLDEAHLVPPFQALLEQVLERQQSQRSGAPGAAVVPSLRVMSLTATGRNAGGVGLFRLTAEHQADPPVRKRLTATKRLRILDEVPSKDLAARLADRALALGKDRGAVLVFCNSRATAQKVREQLAQRHDAALLVGERRVLERSLSRNDPTYSRFLPGRDRLHDDKPAFLVATSAGEVGLDLDADHMVCDLVTWERMVQRLGRVNRRPEPGIACVEVVPARSVSEDKEAETRVADVARLAELRAPLELLPEPEPGIRDASPKAILALRVDPAAGAILAAATSKEPLRPALTQAAIEAWALTSLEQHPGRPLVAPWIRGWTDDPAQTTVLWRRWLPPSGELKAYFDAAPPHLTETLEVPTFRLVDVLKKRVQALGETGFDVSELFLVVLTTSGTVELKLSVSDIKLGKPDDLVRRLAGRTLVIDARLGGLDANGLLDPGAAEPPPTWDAQSPAQDGERGWTEALLQSVGRRAVEAAIGREPAEGWVREAGWPLDTEQDGEDGLELRIERLRSVPVAGDASLSEAQALDAHHRRTVVEAQRIAAALLPAGPLRQVLVVAAELHDLGKARTVWQNAMGAPRNGRPWAKTDGRWTNPSLLQGYRHEFGSLRDAEATLRSTIAEPAHQDLALHLIAAHHGHARPMILPQDPDDPPTLSEVRAREAALRYARLQRDWGPWGLAWWESLLRAADWAASRRSQREGP